MFCLVALVRLWYVQQYAVPLPIWDQWDSEGDFLLRPWAEGTLSFQQLWQPHNEHRIFPTRVQSILLFEATGEWNNLYSARFNVLWAALLAALATVPVVLGRSLGTVRWVLLPVVASCLALPFAWENFLVGFQSQFYFLVLFTALALALTAWRPQDPRAILPVLGLCVLSVLTMAGGLVTPVAVFGVHVLGMRRATQKSHWQAFAMVMLVAITLIAYGTVPHNPGHDALGAQSAGQFGDAVLHIFSWPVAGYHWPMLWLWLPGAVMIPMLWWHRGLGRIDLVMAGCFAWSVGQGLVLAYGRGNGLFELASRYTEVLTPGLLANAWFAVRMLRRWPLPEPKAVGAAVASALFFVVLLGGHAYRVPADLAALEARHAVALVQTRNVQRYLETGDFTALQQPFFEIPYPDAGRLRSLLDNGTIRMILRPTTNAYDEAPPSLPPAAAPGEDSVPAQRRDHVPGGAA